LKNHKNYPDLGWENPQREAISNHLKSRIQGIRREYHAIASLMLPSEKIGHHQILCKLNIWYTISKSVWIIALVGLCQHDILIPLQELRLH
jgi:hypothetical protein